MGLAVDLAGFGGAAARTGVGLAVLALALALAGAVAPVADGAGGVTPLALPVFWGIGLTPKERLLGARTGEGGKSAAGWCRMAPASAAFTAAAGWAPDDDEDEARSSTDCSSSGGVCGRISALLAINSSIVLRM